jgi:hypothetical protein
LMVIPVLLRSSTVEAADHVAGHHHLASVLTWPQSSGRSARNCV